MERLNRYQLAKLVKSVKYNKLHDFTTVCELSGEGFSIIGTAMCRSELTYNRKTGERIAYINALAKLRVLVNGS